MRSAAPTLPAGRIRRAGGGRKKVEVVNPVVLPILQEIVDASTAGSPTDVLRWTSKSKTNLAVALAGRGHRLAPNTVGRLLRQLGYSLQANRKDKEGRSPPERAMQVGYLNDQARTFLERGQPVISVDIKNKELMGDFKNAGRTWQPKGQPIRVQIHDFPSMSIGKAVPHGIYDVAHDRGFVNVGTSHDTPDFAVESIRLCGSKRGMRGTPGRIPCWFWPTAEGATVHGAVFGRCASKPWPMRCRSPSPCATCRLALASGTSKWNKSA